MTCSLIRRCIQEESNRRTLEPWRTYLLTPSWFQQRRRVRQLNEYIIGAWLLSRGQQTLHLVLICCFTGMIRARWQRRQAGEKPVRPIYCVCSNTCGNRV